MKPKHPMKLVELYERNKAEVLNTTHWFQDLVNSVRHYFSPENMPTEDEINDAFSNANCYCDECEGEGFFKGYKAAIERMKR